MEKLNKIAREVYDDEGGYCEGAIEALEQLIMSDKELVQYAVRQIASDSLRHVQREVRTIISNAPGTPAAHYGSSEMRERLNKSLRKYSLYDWPMMNGTKLKDATKEHVLSDATRYRVNEAGNARKARFLEMVARKMKNDQKAGDLSLRVLQKIKQEADVVSGAAAGD